MTEATSCFIPLNLHGFYILPGLYKYIHTPVSLCRHAKSGTIAFPGSKKPSAHCTIYRNASVKRHIQHFPGSNSSTPWLLQCPWKHPDIHWYLTIFNLSKSSGNMWEFVSVSSLVLMEEIHSHQQLGQSLCHLCPTGRAIARSARSVALGTNAVCHSPRAQLQHNVHDPGCPVDVIDTQNVVVLHST